MPIRRLSGSAAGTGYVPDRTPKPIKAEGAITWLIPGHGGMGITSGAVSISVVPLGQGLRAHGRRLIDNRRVEGTGGTSVESAVAPLARF
jgi:hypothetical protein